MASVDVQVNLQLSQRQLNAVTRQIQSSLGNLSAKNLTTIDRELNKGAKSAQTFGDAIGLSARRFVAYTSAVAVVGRLSSALTRATRDAIKFEREFVKLAQVFDTSVKSLGSLSGEISNLSKEFGINANVIARTSVVLAQSGLSARDTEKALRALAKTTLASTFENIGSTAEGAVAILAQFGAGVGALESQLGSINAVAKKFAVESGDIIEAVRRAGGAFNAAGGNLEEFIALFTSVRSTTRESAETIATGFRTIFGRIQRPKTIEYFRQLNIELTDGRGNFIGAFEAIKRLSQGLEQAGIRVGSLKFAEVVEQLGGIRQISRVIPLLTQFGKAQQALNVAQTGSASLTADVAKAQETLSQAFARTQENFSALIREISQTETFQTFVRIALSLANAFIEVARSLKPLIPLIATFGAIKLGGIASQAIKRAGSSGSVLQFNRGGQVPGSGSGDTVPAMLEPGEFVIRKSAVQAFGAENLAGINKYAGGSDKTPRGVQQKDNSTKLQIGKGLGRQIGTSTPISATGKQLNRIVKSVRADDTVYTVDRVDTQSYNTKSNALIANMIGLRRKYGYKNINKWPNWKIFETAVSVINGGLKIAGGSDPFDYPYVPGDSKYMAGGATYPPDDQDRVKGNNNETFLAKLALSGKTKAKKVTSYYPESDNVKKNINGIIYAYTKGNSKKIEKQKYGNAVIPKYAKGGAVGTDTVPALLTPGEFVINKKSAEAYGYGNLKKINKYAKGGVVQKFANGGEVGGGFNIGKLESLFLILPTLLSTFASSLGGADSEVAKFTSAFGQNLLTIKAIQKGSQVAIKGLFNLGRDKDPIQEKSEAAAKSIESSGGEISSSVSSSGKKVAISLETLANAIRGIQDKLKDVKGAVKGEKEARKKLDFVKGQQQQFPGAFPQRFVDAAEKELAEATKKLAKYRSLSGAKARLLGESGFKNQKELNDAVKKEAKEANRRAQAADFLKTKLRESRLKTIKAEGGTLKDAPRSRPFLKSLRGTGSLTNAFGRIAKVAGKIPGPWGKVIQIGSKVVQGLNFLGIALATTVATVFQRIGQNAEEQSERAIQQGDAARAQEQAIRASENKRAAQNLTIATGVLSGILGDAAGGFTATILSLTGVLDPLVNGFTKFGQGLAKAGVSFLNYIDLVDDERAAQFNASFITPEQQLALDGFTAALKASTERLKLQSELLDKEIASTKRTFELIDDYNKKIDYLSKSLQNIVNQREQRTGIVIPGRERPVQYSASLRAGLDELLSKSLGEAFVANLEFKTRTLSGPISGYPGLEEGVDVVINQAMMDQMQEFSKALDEAKKSLENFNIKVLEQISFSLSVAKTNEDIYRILKIDSNKFRFTLGEAGDSILSFESIISSPILKEAFISLYKETGSLEEAQRRLSASVRVETELKRASIEYEKTRINAFSNLLQKFTFGTGEERFGIGQDIKSVEKLVNSGFDINARNIAESERSRILSFLQSAPGALFKTKDGVVSSEDIAVKTILKQFEGLDLSGLLTGADQETVDAIKDTDARDKKRQELIEQRLKESLYPQRAALEELKAINGGVSELVNASKGQVPNAQQTVADEKAKAELKSEVPEYDTARAAKEAGIDKLIDTIKIDGTATVDVESANILVGKITNEQKEKNRKEFRDAANNIPIGPIPFNKGGIIYAQNGTLVNFEPRGTDTVPAMLTPGEFVVNARATKNNLSLLEAINAGAYSGGGVVYLAKGGQAPYDELTEEELKKLEKDIANSRRNTIRGIASVLPQAGGDLSRAGSLLDSPNALRTVFKSEKRRRRRNIDAINARVPERKFEPVENIIARAKQSSRTLKTADQNRDRITYDDRFNVPRATGGQSRAFGGRTIIAGDRVINYAAASGSKKLNPLGEDLAKGRYKQPKFYSGPKSRTQRFFGGYSGPKTTKVFAPPAYGAEGPSNRQVGTLTQYNNNIADFLAKNPPTTQRPLLDKGKAATIRESRIQEAAQARATSRSPLPSYFLKNQPKPQPKPQTPPPTPPTQRFPTTTGQFGRRRLNPPGFSRGGFVNPQYLANGGQAYGESVDTSALAGFAASFGASVSNLINSSITMEIAPIGINVNLNGAELLSRLPEMVQGLVMDSIRTELTLFEQTKDFNNTPGAYASAIR